MTADEARGKVIALVDDLIVMAERHERHDVLSDDFWRLFDKLPAAAGDLARLADERQAMKR